MKGCTLTRGAALLPFFGKDNGYVGFRALAGWDPATGMGTPDYPKLLQAAMAAADVTVNASAQHRA